MLVWVTRWTLGAPGGPGAVGAVEPPHDAPLSVQLAGDPPPAPMSPNAAVAPGASVPFQDLLRNSKRCPLRVRSASQKLLTELPLGRSKATVQPFMVVAPPLVIVYLPSQPEPQSEVLTKG